MEEKTKLTLSFSEAAKLIGTGKDNVSRLVNEGILGFIAFDKLKNNKRIPVIEVQRFIKENTGFLKVNPS
jgi:excisionase family DNA binding protein